MNESRLWGGLGVLLALVGLVVIAPEVLGAVAEGGFADPIVFYGVGVALAVVATLVVVGPSLSTQ